MSGVEYPSVMAAIAALRADVETLKRLTGGGIQFNSENDAPADRWLHVAATDPDGDGYLMRIVGAPADPGTDPTGDVLIGFPVDGSAALYEGSVVFGVGYSGERAFKFLVDDDDGGTTEGGRIDDQGFWALNGHFSFGLPGENKPGFVLYFDTRLVTALNDTGQTFEVQDAGGVQLVTVGEDGHITLRLKSGESFTVLDSAGDPMLQMTDGSPDLHIPTGGTVVADL